MEMTPTQMTAGQDGNGAGLGDSRNLRIQSSISRAIAVLDEDDWNVALSRAVNESIRSGDQIVGLMQPFVFGPEQATVQELIAELGIGHPFSLAAAPPTLLR